MTGRRLVPSAPTIPRPPTTSRHRSRRWRQRRWDPQSLVDWFFGMILFVFFLWFLLILRSLWWALVLGSLRMFTVCAWFIEVLLGLQKGQAGRWAAFTRPAREDSKWWDEGSLSSCLLFFFICLHFFHFFHCHGFMPGMLLKLTGHAEAVWYSWRSFLSSVLTDESFSEKEFNQVLCSLLPDPIP